MSDLKVDPARAVLHHEDTGIYIRAVDASGKWGAFDISELDEASLRAWLRSRDTMDEDVVCILLGHRRDGASDESEPPCAS